MYAAVNVKERTFQAYEGSLRCHLIPYFGERYLSEFTRRDIEAFRLVREEEAKKAAAEVRQPRAPRCAEA